MNKQVHADGRRVATVGRGAGLGIASAVALLALAVAPVEAGAASVTIVLSDEPSTLDPCQSASNAVGRVNLGNMFETLIVRDIQTGELVPHLATSWERVDELTWRFQLREGVTFHDGTALDAEAVKASIDRTMSPNMTCEIRTKFLGDRTLEVTAVDDLTIEVKTEQPDPILPLMMTTHTVHAPGLPPDEPSREGAGTGPYRLVEWAPGQRIVLERFDDYWGEAPEVERAEFQWRSESSVRAAMVRQGEADLAPDIAPQDVVEGIGRSYPNSESIRLNLDAEKAPMDDVRVRAAMRYAIDREAMLGTVISEDSLLATHLILPQINGHNPNIPQWPYDPELARALLDDARADGVPVDAEIEFVGRIGHFPNADVFHEAIALMLQDVGLNVRLQWYEAAQKNRMQVKPFDENRLPQIIVDQHDNNRGDAGFTVPSRYHSSGSQSKTNDAYLDFLIDHASQATGEARIAAWHRVHERILLGLVADVMLFHMVGYAAVGPRIDYAPNLETNSVVRLSDIGMN